MFMVEGKDGSQVPLVIRHSEKVGQQARARGRLAHELEVEMADQKAWLLEALRKGEPVSARPSSTTVGVASDLRALASVMLDRISEWEAAQ
jgi:hypothetical protein